MQNNLSAVDPKIPVHLWFLEIDLDFGFVAGVN